MEISSTERKVKKENYFRQVQKELKKVSWTSKKDLYKYTKVVIGSTFLFGLGIYGVDMAVRGSLNLLSYVSAFIGG